MRISCWVKATVLGDPFDEEQQLAVAKLIGAALDK